MDRRSYLGAPGTAVAGTAGWLGGESPNATLPKTDSRGDVPSEDPPASARGERVPDATGPEPPTNGEVALEGTSRRDGRDESRLPKGPRRVRNA